MPPLLWMIAEFKAKNLGVGPQIGGFTPLPGVYLRVFGVTKNSSGVAIGYCAVHLFRTSDDVEVDQVISDAAGNYEFRSASLTTTYYVVAYKAAGYLAAALATVPGAYWRVGEPSGTVVTDAMAVNNGTYLNTPTLGVAGLLTGDPDTAVTLNGTNEYITFANSATFDCFEGTNPWTFAIWLDNHTPDANQRHILNITDQTSDWVTISSQSGYFLVSRHNGAGGDDLMPSPLAAGRHLLVATYSGSALALYVDGALAPGGTNPLASTRSLTSFTSSLFIGADGWFGGNGFGNPFNGTLDEPKVWTRALSAAEISALYTAGTTVTTDLSGTTVNTLVGS